VADYSKNKEISGKLVPTNAVDSAWIREEPLITPKGIRDRILWGIKLQSKATNQVMTDEQISDFIQDAVAKLESESQLTIFPVQHDERQEFDRNLWLSMGYFQLRQRPVQSIQSIRVETSNGIKIWDLNLDWVDSGYLSRGQVYILPINIAAVSTASGQPAGAAVFMSMLSQQAYVPAFWKITYTTGFKDGMLPRIVNLLVGIQAGIDILQKLAATNAMQGSKSIGIDGLSQSNSNPGPDLYTVAITQLEKDKKVHIGKLRNLFGLKFASGNI
jgi:hypothetical protein